MHARDFSLYRLFSSIRHRSFEKYYYFFFFLVLHSNDFLFFFSIYIYFFFLNHEKGEIFLREKNTVCGRNSGWLTGRTKGCDSSKIEKKYIYIYISEIVAWVQFFSSVFSFFSLVDRGVAAKLIKKRFTFRNISK